MAKYWKLTRPGIWHLLETCYFIYVTSGLHAESAIPTPVKRRLFAARSYNIGYQDSGKEITSSPIVSC